MSVRYSTPERQCVVQIAYHVPDLDEAMRRWTATAGIGPFVVRRHIRLDEVCYRGIPATLDISAAHAQSGDVQIELVQQHCTAPSAFRDMFDARGQGLHHVALFPEDHAAMVGHYRAQGFEVATDLWTAEGRGASYVDTRSLLGHMTEVYRVNESLLEFYALVRSAADTPGGRGRLIEL